MAGITYLTHEITDLIKENHMTPSSNKIDMKLSLKEGLLTPVVRKKQGRMREEGIRIICYKEIRREQQNKTYEIKLLPTIYPPKSS